MKRRIYGIPVPIAICLALALMATAGVMAALLIQRDVPSTVSVVGIDDAEVYSDQACTTPLTSLAFSDIMQGETTSRSRST